MGSDTRSTSVVRWDLSRTALPSSGIDLRFCRPDLVPTSVRRDHRQPPTMVFAQSRLVESYHSLQVNWCAWSTLATLSPMAECGHRCGLKISLIKLSRCFDQLHFPVTGTMQNHQLAFLISEDK